MAKYNYNESENYQLQSENDNMYVSIVSGNGQGGSYFILKDKKIISANETAFIGKANDNVNKTIQVLVAIQDKQVKTNWTGVLVVITEGSQKTVYSYANELPADKDIASYNININIKR